VEIQTLGALTKISATIKGATGNIFAIVFAIWVQVNGAFGILRFSDELARTEAGRRSEVMHKTVAH
jgi:hypothetical protein